MNYFVQSLDVCHLFQELELSKAVVMGHSMGGKTAMTLALSHPECVHSLIVVDMSPTKLTLDDDIPQYLAAKRDMNLAFVNNKQDAERMLMNAVPVRKVFVFSKLLALMLRLSSITLLTLTRLFIMFSRMILKKSPMEPSPLHQNK